MAQNKLWLIKNKKGRTQGPLSADEITELIKSRELKGEESIAEYPGNKWKPISTEPQFYDLLFEALSQTNPTRRSEKKSSDSSKTFSKTGKASSEEETDFSSKTLLVDLSELKNLRKKRSRSRSRSSKMKKKRSKSSMEKTLIFESEELINNEEADYENQHKHRPKKSKKKLFITLALVGAFALFFFQDNNNSADQEYVALEAVKKSQPLSKQKRDVLLKKGLVQYLRGTVTSSLKAQNLFVRAIGGNEKDTYGRAMLCLVYLGLWPFTKQDFKSSNTIDKLNRKISVLNKGGVRAGLCHSVTLIVKGKYKDARTMIDSSLDGISNNVNDIESQRLLPMFYYLKSLVLYYLNDYGTALSFLETIQKTLPTWITPYALAAEIFEKQNKTAQAFALYKKILKLDSKHKVTKLKIGLIEYKKFNKKIKAENTLQIALSYPDIISYQILSEAHLVLAEIKLKKSDTKQALYHAQKSYSYNPLDNSARNLVIQIGGQDSLSKLTVRKSQLVYEGDQSFLRNEFRRAVGLYEEAFKLDEKRGAMIAVKIARSYKALSFTYESIKWLKKAVNINPFLMEAYVLMAKYYSENYDFHNAEKILQIAFQKSPRSYELYRGQAHLFLEKEDYQKTIGYARQALKIYESDVESYVLLSRAYAKIGNSGEALAYATRSLELDPNSTNTQVAYARALGQAREVTEGIAYFKKLIQNYPLIIEYRMELVKFLFEDEQYKRALEVVRNIISVEPKYQESYFYLGRILMYEHNFAGAYEAFLQAAIVNPADPKPTFYIGQLRLEEKKYSEAETQFRKVLDLNKLYPKAHYYLGRIAFIKKDYKKAIKHAHSESRANPKLLRPYLLVAESYYQMGHQKKGQLGAGEYLDCAREYQKAIELAPENLNLYIKTARCYRKSGLLDLAVKILKKGGEGKGKSRSGDPQLYKELGLVYEMRGDYDRANGSFCNYLNLLPTARDRSSIEARMKKLSTITGKKVKNCG